MLLFMSRPRKTKTRTQSSERGVVATGKPDELLGSLFVKRHIRFLCCPEMMEQDSQLASYCNNSFTPRLPAAP